MTEQGNSGQRPLTSQSQAFTNTNQLTMASGANISGTGDGMDGLAPIFPPTNFDVPDISFSNSVIPNADFNTSLFNNSSHMFASSGAQYGDTPSPSVGAGQLQKNYFPPPSNSPPGTSSSDDSDDLPLAQLAKRGLTASTGNLTGGGSPSGLGTDATSLENSPISNNKKTKSAKRKKKKDPNEPQKPVSAYALFFRDTQATIKGHNPNASFGDVSKIVASMWDQLDPEHKDVYKKKTETAKKQYLKQLAAYRASQVSQSAMDESESSSSPPSTMTPAGATLMSPMLLPGAVSQPAAHIPVTVSGQMIQQPQQQMMQHMVQQQQMQQMQQHFPPHQMVIGQQGSPSPPLQQQHSPIQQQGSPPAQVYSSPPHSGGDQVVVNSYQHPVMDNTMYGGYTDPPTEMDMNYPHCVRSGCGNYAKENPSWDSEYCSNDCVISHCRDIFTKWVASRTDSNSFPVK